MTSQRVVTEFLIKLESSALHAEEEKRELELINNTYKYVSDLLEVVTASKIAFVEGYFSLKKSQKDEFISLMEKVIPNTEELYSILAEIKNFNFLIISNLLKREEVTPQKAIAIRKIDELISMLKKFQSQINIKKNTKKINELNDFITKIIELGTKFEDDTLIEEIDDIDFLQTILKEISLTTEDELDLLFLIMRKNVDIYTKKLQKETTKEAKEIQALENEKTTDELLEEMFAEIEQLETQPSEKSK